MGARPLEFILAGPDGQVDATTRKKLRSFVMSGKNKGKGKKAKQASSSSDSTGTGHDNSPHQDLTAALGPAAAGEPPVTLEPEIPRSVALPLATLPYAEEMEPYMLDLVSKHFRIVKAQLYPLQWCLKTEKFDNVWFNYLMTDRVFIHGLLFATCHVYNIINAREVTTAKASAAASAAAASSSSAASESLTIVLQNEVYRHHAATPASQTHFQKTLRLLHERLQHADTLATGDSTIAVVVLLAFVAGLGGDIVAARAHLQGLKKMVDLRGGMRCLEDNWHLQHHICDLDLAMALLALVPPVFSAEDVPWDAHVLLPGLLLDFDPATLPYGISRFIVSLDNKIAGILYDVISLVKITCEIHDRRYVISPNVIRQSTVSVLSRLWTLHFKDQTHEEYILSSTGANGVWRRAFVLALLAFSASVFLQLGTIQVEYHLLKCALQQAILALEHVEHPSSSLIPLRQEKLSLIVWLGMIARAAFPTDEGNDTRVDDRVKQAAEALSIDSWEACKASLETILWVEVLHDKRGQAAYERVLAGTLRMYLMY